MKSVCIKINNTSIIEYLLNKFSSLDLEHFYISSNSFKIYDNVIVHYSGDNLNLFFDYVCSILTDTVIKFYEPIKLKKDLNKDFFYFLPSEKNRILELCKEENSDTSEFFEDKYFSIYNAFSKYIHENHSLVLSGFFTFRLYDYHQKLDYILNTCINRYLIEREYFEFINILRLYINSNPPHTSNLNLIYLKDQSLLFDENNQNIDIKSSNSLHAKFLSDITFSDNDYVLNYLLNTLPSHLTLHIPFEGSLEDDFINTLKLIFENRVSICNNCNLCCIYKHINIDIN